MRKLRTSLRMLNAIPMVSCLVSLVKSKKGMGGCTIAHFY